MKSESENSQLTYPKKNFSELNLTGKITMVFFYINILYFIISTIFFISSLIINERNFFLLTSAFFFSGWIFMLLLLIISIWTAPGNIMNMDGKTKKENVENILTLLLFLIGGIIVPFYSLFI